MSELRGLIAASRALRAAHEPFVTATLVSVKGSSYRRPGARLLIAEDRWLAGSISGGCLERDLVRRAWWRTAEGRPVLVSYDSTAEADDGGWGLGLGCNGVVELLLERSGAGIDALAFMEGCLADERPGVLVTLFRGPREAGGPDDVALGTCLALRADRPALALLAGVTSSSSAMLEAQARAALAAGGAGSTIRLPSGEEALIERIEPPIHLFVMGAGPDAVPVVRAARAVGWTVSVWAPQSRFEARRQFSEADHLRGGPATALAASVAAAYRPAAVVMSHSFDRDREALDMLLRSPCSYVGVLGPQHRTGKLLAALGPAVRPGSPANRRLRAPIGLAIGAETPDEVALSVVAEVQAALTGEAGGPLRDRSGPIHAVAERDRPRLAASD